MRFFLIILAVVTFFPAAMLANGSRLTLEEAWQLALKYDPSLKASREIINESMGKKVSAISPFLPRVSGRVQIRHYTKEEGFVWDSGAFGWGILPFPATEKTVPEYRVGIEQTVFDSGKSIAGYKASSYGLSAATHTFFAAQQNRAIELTYSYCNFYLAKKQEDVAKTSRAALFEHERVARLKFQQELVQKTDLLTAEVAAEKAKIDVIEAADNLVVTREKLATLIGEEAYDIAEPVVPYPPESVFTPADRPEIRAKTAEINVSRMEALKEGLSYLPDFFARADAAYIDDDYRMNKDQYTFWGGLRWPLFDGRYHWGQRKSARARERKSRYEKRAMEEAYSVELTNAKKMWYRSDKEISVAKLNKGRASENLRRTRLEYEEGLASAMDVRDAVKLWSESELTYYRAICNRQIAAAHLRLAAGMDILEDGGLNVE